MMSDNADTTTNAEAPPATPSQIQQFESIVTNTLLMREQLFRKFLDPRRSVNDECGYPEGTTFDSWTYQSLYDRNPIANRVVSLMPKETWAVTPLVYEDNSATTSTPFEEAWDNLSRQLRGHSFYQDEESSPVWEYLQRVDEQSGIGSFALLLLGIDDGLGLDVPVEGMEPDGKYPSMFGGVTPTYGPGPGGAGGPDIKPLTGQLFGGAVGTDAQYFTSPYGQSLGPQGQTGGSGPTDKKKKAERKLIFLRVFAEHLVQITQYETDFRSPRFGQPVMYLITLNDPRERHTGAGLSTAQVRVHWTRVLHVADNLTSSEIFGVPRMRPVLNRLMDLDKIYGAGGEGYWKSCFSGLALTTHPQLGGDVKVDKKGLRDTVEDYQNGLQRYLLLMGMSAETLPPQAVDPTPYITICLEAICIQLGCPVRVFKGSERGELASSQDDSKWNDRIRGRQNGYVTPRVIIPFIDRLIQIGILPEPKQGKDEKQSGSKIKVAPPAPPAGGGFGGKPPGGAPPPKVPIPKASGAPPTGNRLVWNDFPPSNGSAGTDAADAAVSPPAPNATPAPPSVKIMPPKQVIKAAAGYSIEWPDLDSLSKKDKAAIALQTVQAIAAYVAGNVEAILPPADLYTKVLGWDEEETQVVLMDALQSAEEKAADAAATADEQGLEPTPPPGFQKPVPDIPPTIKVGPGETLHHPDDVKPGEPLKGQKPVAGAHMPMAPLGGGNGKEPPNGKNGEKEPAGKSPFGGGK